VDAERYQSRGRLKLYTETLTSPVLADMSEAEVARDQEDPCRVSDGPHVRLRVSQPKIMLRLKVRDTSRPERNNRKGTKIERAKKGSKGGNQKNRTRGGTRKGRKEAKEIDGRIMTADGPKCAIVLLFAPMQSRVRRI
jgi:hypothetical protein